MPARVCQLDTNEIMVSAGAGPGAYPRAAFTTVATAAERADEVRGDLDALPDNAVIFIGETTGKNYYVSHDLDVLRDDFREAIESAGYTIVDGVSGGWSNWDGRPEWSDNYLDVTGAEVVTDA